jgi:hypothetical protein
VSNEVVKYASACGTLQTVFGWKFRWPFGNRPFEDPNPRQLRNWPVQSNASEMLRYAVYLGLSQKIKIIGLIHDAVLIEAPISEIDHAVTVCKTAMMEASKIILQGFGVTVDAKIVKYPDRYMDPRGQDMWKTISGILDRQVCKVVTPVRQVCGIDYTP